MRLRFWGTRGSIPTPGPATVRYGGNTACLELRTPAGELIVLDCGTGARPLGLALVAEAQAAGTTPRGSILLGHTHWDHIQGLPFFAPLFDPASHWDLYGPRGLDVSLHQTLAGQMSYQYFPVTLDQLGAQVADHDLVEGTFTIGDATVWARYLNHTALTLGYRIECAGAVVCYLSDHEPFDPALAAGGDVQASAGDARHVAFMAGADVVVHDAQYEAAEYATRRGWGHSTVEYVVDCAVAAEVARVVLFHHDPSRDDAAVDALLARARLRAAGRVEVLAAAEGGELLVGANGRRSRAVPMADTPAVVTPAVGALAPQVLLAVKEAAARAGVLAAATAEHLPVIDLTIAGAGAEAPPAGVVVVDLDDPSSESALDELPPAAGDGGDGRATLGPSVPASMPALPSCSTTAAAWGRCAPSTTGPGC